jgi:hypothetical protein
MEVPRKSMTWVSVLALILGGRPENSQLDNVTMILDKCWEAGFFGIEY